MRGIAWFLGGIGVIVGIIAAILFGAFPAGATAAQAWQNGSKVVSQSERGNIYDGVVCGGERFTIQVIGSGTFAGACVFGDAVGVRVARFNTGTTYLYAVSFPGSTQFYELRGVCPFGQCAYSSATDVYLTVQSGDGNSGIVAYRHFSNHLIKRFDEAKAAIYFQFQPPTPDYYLKAGDVWPAARAIGMSANGKWAAVELKEMGIVRLDTETFETKRFIAASGRYGYGGNPSYELAISNDGTMAVVTGRNAGFAVIAIDKDCGDRVVQDMQRNYSPTIIPCTNVSVNLSPYIDAVSYIASPRFDAAGHRFGMTVYHTDGTSERLVVEAQGAGASRKITYVALGDSFTSGEGETDGTQYRPLSDELPLRCHVSTRSYPYLVGIYWRVATESAACSGARTVDILGGDFYTGQGGGLSSLPMNERIRLRETAIDTFRSGAVPQSEFVSAYQPRVASIGIGGNDAGLVGKLTGCLNLGTCEWASDPVKRYATAQEIAAVYPRIIESIKRVQAVSPATKVVVVGYPQIINAENDAKCTTSINLLLTHEERVFIWETIGYLNRIVQAAAAATSVAFVDVENTLDGHELCGTIDTTAMNDIRLGNDIAPVSVLPKLYVFGAESFHPTPAGHRLIAEKIKAEHPSSETIVSCLSQCDLTVPVPTPSAYWMMSEPPAQYTKQVYNDTLIPAVIQPGATFDLHVPRLSFAPQSVVQVELHSQPVTLARLTISSDGSLQQTIALPDDIPTGYHTLHLLGTSPAGESIDIYDSVAVVYDEQQAAGESTFWKGKKNRQIAPTQAGVLGWQDTGAYEAAKVTGATEIPRTLQNSPKMTRSILLIALSASLTILIAVLVYRSLTTRRSSHKKPGKV